jgi:Tol biopolymer transport system component
MNVQGAFVGAAWNRDDVIVASLRYGLYRIPAAGGTPTQVATIDRSRQENSLRWPQFLPDGHRFVYVARSGRPDKSSAYVGFLDGRPPVRLMEAGAQVRYSATGHLLYLQDGVLLARAVDPSTWTFSGEPVPIVDGIRGQGSGLRARYSLSDTGVLVHQPQVDEARFQLRWYDRTGRRLGDLGPPDRLSNFRISPDGARVVIDLNDNPRGGRSVWAVDVASGNRTRVTFGESDDWQPIWARDGGRILFGSYRNGPLDLYARPADGAAPMAAVLESEVQKDPSDVSKDGRTILVSESTAERLNDVVAYELGSGTRTVIASTESAELRGRFSPDDRWVAYQSDESGRAQIYVQPFPPTGAKWQVTTDRGVEPHWSADGRELYYLEPGRGIMALAVDTVPDFHRAPGLLVKVPTAALGAGATSFDVTADGRRFLVREPVNETVETPVQVILNWPALLAKAPTE